VNRVEGAALGGDGDEALGAVVRAVEGQAAGEAAAGRQHRGGDAGRVADAVDGVGDGGGVRAAGEVQDLHAVIPGDLQRHRLGGRAGLEVQLRGAGAGDDVHLHRDVRIGAEVGLRDVQRGHLAGGHAAGQVIEAAVDEVQSGEGGRVADAGDALDGGIDLEL